MIRCIIILRSCVQSNTKTIFEKLNQREGPKEIERRVTERGKASKRKQARGPKRGREKQREREKEREIELEKVSEVKERQRSRGRARLKKEKIETAKRERGR